LRGELNKTTRAKFGRIQYGKKASDQLAFFSSRNLDKDWIEVASDAGAHHIVGLAEPLDDVIGPMLNR
jgi:hypothetical protein